MPTVDLLNPLCTASAYPNRSDRVRYCACRITTATSVRCSTSDRRIHMSPLGHYLHTTAARGEQRCSTAASTSHSETLDNRLVRIRLLRVHIYIYTACDIHRLLCYALRCDTIVTSIRGRSLGDMSHQSVSLELSHTHTHTHTHNTTSPYGLLHCGIKPVGCFVGY